MYNEGERRKAALATEMARNIWTRAHNELLKSQRIHRMGLQGFVDALALVRVAIFYRWRR